MSIGMMYGSSSGPGRWRATPSADEKVSQSWVIRSTMSNDVAAQNPPLLSTHTSGPRRCSSRTASQNSGPCSSGAVWSKVTVSAIAHLPEEEPATVDDHRLAGDELGRVAYEKQHGPDHVV